ncbi:MAG TPA: CPBP family intramembrane glutamic endopeptidase [Candidatus Acidoferrum sp.]|nr:CPBP family intramembrane glutamic endopeptidase [Candidatus Acidoferrum sp.]
MSLFDENSVLPPDQEPPSQSPAESAPSATQPPANLAEIPLPGDPISLAANVHADAPAYKPLPPEDLRISWSWLHFAVFLSFVVVSFFIVQLGFMVYYAGPLRHLHNEKDFERFALSKPGFAVGSMVLLYALVLLFLYVSLSVLPGSPFWRTLGWRKITRHDGGRPRSPWLFFLAGCGLSVVVFVVTAKMQAPEDLPIEELFHYKNTAILFMAMAVLVAPLVEETVFRGYLYPLFAKSFGVASSVIITGVLFGLMHGAQLGWTWGLVFVLIAVGVIFTFVRARTGSVFASFLLHLGYNSTIALVTILGTTGFTRMPPTH